MGIGEQNSFFQASQGFSPFPVWIRWNMNLETEISDEYDISVHRRPTESRFFPIFTVTFKNTSFRLLGLCCSGVYFKN